MGIEHISIDYMECIEIELSDEMEEYLKNKFNELSQ